MTNRLSTESSPYLRQHAGQPGRLVSRGARRRCGPRVRRDRPILLSVGYSACHWCHVMAHELFENPGIAALLNEHFISVKVDREERPDVDRLYMAFVQAMTGSGGWPMSVLAYAGAEALFRRHLFSARDRAGGMPGFPAVLRAAHDAYRRNRARRRALRPPRSRGTR